MTVVVQRKIPSIQNSLSTNLWNCPRDILILITKSGQSLKGSRINITSLELQFTELVIELQMVEPTSNKRSKIFHTLTGNALTPNQTVEGRNEVIFIFTF
jgi:hypothetical protein